MYNRQGGEAAFYNRESFKFTIIATILLGLPVLNLNLIWLQLVAPLPVFYGIALFGREKGVKLLAAAILVTGTVAMSVGTIHTFAITLSLLPAGYIFARSLQKGIPPLQGAIWGMIYFLLLGLVWWVIFGFSSETSLFEEIVKNIDEGITAAQSSITNSQELTVENTREIEQTLQNLRKLFPLILPGMLVSSIIMIVGLNLITGQGLIAKRSAELRNWPPYQTWRLPEQLVFGVIATGILLIIPVEIVQITGWNFSLVFGIIYFFQGLAIVTALFNKWSVPGILRIVFYLLIFMQLYAIILLTLTGIADIWLDFRKKIASQKNEKQD